MDTPNGTKSANGTSIQPKLLWKHAEPHSTPMYQYLQSVNQTYNVQLSTYPELYQWSIKNIDAFWQSVWKFTGVRADGDASPVSRREFYAHDVLTPAGSRSRSIHVSTPYILQEYAVKLCRKLTLSHPTRRPEISGHHCCDRNYARDGDMGRAQRKSKTVPGRHDCSWSGRRRSRGRICR
jgi:hypothetical protein